LVFILKKIFNFNKLSDQGATTRIELLLEQMVGNQTIKIEVALADIPDKYWFGRRLYLETYLAGRLEGPAHRMFLDVPDRAIQVFQHKLQGWKIVLIVLGVAAFLFACGYVGWIYYKRRPVVVTVIINPPKI